MENVSTGLQWRGLEAAVLIGVALEDGGSSFCDRHLEVGGEVHVADRWSRDCIRRAGRDSGEEKCEKDDEARVHGRGA